MKKRIGLRTLASILLVIGLANAQAVERPRGVAKSSGLQTAEAIFLIHSGQAI